MPSIALMRGIWAILYIVSIVLFYRLGRHLLPPFAAFAAAAMLIGQQHTPLYTYNHIGFVLATQGILLLLLDGVSNKATGHFRSKMAVLLLMALLIKFNEALVVFVVVVVVLWVANWRRGENAIGRNASNVMDDHPRYGCICCICAHHGWLEYRPDKVPVPS